MRNLAIIGILVALLLATLRRPWLGVLALAVVAYLPPAIYAVGSIRAFPVYTVLSCEVALAILFHRNEWQWPPHDWRLTVLLLLWGYFLFTTWYAAIYPPAAWRKFWEVSIGLGSLVLTLVLINSREKLFYLLVTIATCIALVTVKGGLWAIMTGFGNMVFGPPTSQYFDNNLFAVLMVMNIPLLVLWLRETRNETLRYGLMLTLALSVAAVLGTWSRGGLLALGVTILLLLWHSQRKFLALLLLLAAVGLTFIYLPEDWFARMQSITTYEQDQSAMGRLELWKIGLTQALQHPLMGIGFDGWLITAVRPGATRMNWHNAYVAIMAEHGFLAFALWCSLLIGTIVSLTRLAWLSRRFPVLAWVSDYSLMLRASLIGYAIGVLFEELAYWNILYQLLVIAILLKHLALTEVARMISTRPRAGESPAGTAPAAPVPVL
ncbi:MAG: putative O-glycosylation ligase, exosortase A system-associated [Candidatus Competibacteraceae bacterium]